MGATPNIFYPEIQKTFEYVKANSDSFFPSGNSYSLFFCAQFRIPWILCWDFCTHQSQPSPFPKYLAREFKIKCSYSLFFCAQFRIPWILCWDFCTHQSQPSPFPKYLLGNSKSNGGPLSKYPKPKPLKMSKTGSKPKSLNRKSL